MSFEIKELSPRIFLLEFTNQYDLAMHFLRYQEFYESPNDDIRGKSFTILDAMEQYSKKYHPRKPVFSYPRDYVGFNIPHNIIQNVRELSIRDKNKYDAAMYNIYRKLKRQCGNKSFYIIGCMRNDTAIIKHEYAHALFYTDASYRRTAKKLVAELLDKHRQPFVEWLSSEGGYAATVHVDETQAYFATGLPHSFRVILPKRVLRPFVLLFQEHSKEVFK
jgi:hypothetical protein